MDNSPSSDPIESVLENVLDTNLVQPPPEPQIKLGGTTHATAKKASEFLISLDVGFCTLNKKQRINVLVAYAERGFVVYGKAFDLIRCDTRINFDDVKNIRDNLSKLVIYEIKSTNKKTVKPDFSRYFFSLSTAELLTAQSLGERYRFAFVNTVTRAYEDLSLNEVFVKARGIYPSWSIQF